MISNNVMLDSLQSDHTTLEGLKMLVLTWNVNAKLEELPNLRKLFFREEEKCFGGTPEIVVLGLQEMVELSTSNVIGGKIVGNAAERVDQWRAMLLTTLKERDVTFEMVTSKNMVGLWITVFSLRSFKQHISKVQVAQLGRGVGGVLGNKGAVYARFNVKDTSICLVCAHFAAHRENLLKRNEDFHAILTHKAFPGLLDGASSTTEYKHLSQHNTIHMTTEAARVDRLQDKIIAMKKTLMDKRIPVSPPIDLKKEQLANYTSAQDHDVIIWLGDLNYRLLGGMDNSRIYDIIDGKRSYALLNLDQLNIEKDKGTVFQGFHEGLIPFDPTYKYIPGSANYNRERCPAWCDRVLWKLKKADLDIEVFGDLDTYVSEERFSVKSGNTVNFTKVRSATVANKSETVELSSGEVVVDTVATVVVDSVVTADSTGVTDTFVLSSTDIVVDNTTATVIDTTTIINTINATTSGVMSPFSPLSECSVDGGTVESSKFSDPHTSVDRNSVTFGGDVVESVVQNGSAGGSDVIDSITAVDLTTAASNANASAAPTITLTDNTTDNTTDDTTDNTTDNTTTNIDTYPTHTTSTTDTTTSSDVTHTISTTTNPTTHTTNTTDTTTITTTTTAPIVDTANDSASSSDTEEGDEQTPTRVVDDTDSARVLGSINEGSEGSDEEGSGSDGEGSEGSGGEESEGESESEGEGESSGDEEGRRSLIEGSDVDDHRNITTDNTNTTSDGTTNTTIPTTPYTPTPTGTPHTPSTAPHTTTPHTHTPHSTRKSTKGPRKPKRSFRSLPPMPEIRSSVYLVPEARVTEIVELMVYNRGENIISDHKPVRALLGVKFKRVDWSGHELHLLDHYTKKCQERPFHTKSFQMLHGHTPVSFSPRTVTLLSGFNPERTQSVEVFNHSPTHSVKFGIMADSLPGWMRVSVSEGVVAPGQVVTIEVECCSAEADHSYIHALEEDARYAEAKLRDVWRRHIRNPDDRGNPQLSAVLQVHLCTHLSPDAAFMNKINVKSFGKAMRPGDLPESALASTNSATAVTTDTNDGDADMFTVRMAPLSIPVLCKVSTK